MPEVSILMPFKNSAKWISGTVKSIQNQDFLDWELIAVDDFSTDSSSDILHELSTRDNRIKLYQNESSGIIPALQLALRKSNGDYITRMDSDDLMPECRLTKMLQALKLTPQKTIITGKVRYFSVDEVSEGYQKYESWLNERILKNDFFDHIFRECVVASPNWIARKAELMEHNIFQELVYPEDYDMTFRWMNGGFSIQGIEDLTLLWREHPERTSRNSKVYQQNSFFELKLSWLIQLYPNVKSIGIIGFGQKGKICASFLNNSKISFSIYDLEFNKFNQPYFGKSILNPNQITDELILLARYPKNPTDIEEFVMNQGYIIGKNAFWI